jgi:hypothetical protein
MKYPLTCTTHATKSAFTERALKLLYIEHNIMGAWFKPGEPIITETQYQKLRAGVQTRWPYTGEKLSKVEWENYKTDRFDIKREILISERGRLKELLCSSTRFAPNLDDDII